MMDDALNNYAITNASVCIECTYQNVCIYKGFLLVTEEAGSQTGPEFRAPYFIYCLTKLTLTK